MKRFFTILLITLFGLATSLMAQTEEDEQIELVPRKFKNSIGFNTKAGYDYFKNNYPFIPIELIYRRQVSENSALRFGLGFSQSIRTRNIYLPWSSSHTILAPSIGKEWEIRASRRWSFLYGADLKFSYMNFASRVKNVSRVDDGTFEEERAQLRENDLHNFYGGFSPFVGVKWEFSKRFYFYAQTGFDIGFRRFSQERRTTELLGGQAMDPTVVESMRGSQFLLNRKMFSGIQLNYKF